MRYLVTGGAGFIGSNTVDELVRRGGSVVVLDDLSSGKEENLAEIHSKITFIKGSITDIEVVRKAMHGAEYVLHLAARTSVPRSVKDPIETNRINIDGTLNVLVAAKELKVKRVVFAASSSAYGETATLPKIESMQPAPISPYGVTKYVGELYAQTFGRCYGLESVSLSLGHGKIPTLLIPACSPNSVLHFLTAISRLYLATASKPGTLPTSKMRFRLIY